MTVKRLEIYADGAVIGGSGRGNQMGYAAVCLYKGRVREFKGGKIQPKASSNEAELKAILLGLEKVKPTERPISHVLVFSDSEWSVRSIRGEYANRQHIDLLRRIRSLMKTFYVVEVMWTRGHCGQTYNERAHQLANQAAREAVA